MKTTPLFLASLWVAATALHAQTAPPLLNSISPASVPAGSPAIVLTLNGSNFQPGATINFGGRQLPAQYGGATRLQADIPASLLTAAGVLTVTVANPNGDISNWVLFTVGGGSGGALTIVAGVLPAASAGQSYSYNFVASGGRPPYSWTATNTLPAGLTLSASGTLSGTAPAVGQYSIAVRVSDSGGSTATATVSLGVTVATFGVSSPNVLPSGRTGQSYIYALTASGGIAPLRWSITQGALPAGLSLDGTTGVISGTPTTSGTASFTIQVIDSAQSIASKLLTLPVDSAPLSITTRPPLSSGTVGEPYSQIFRAAGGAPPYSWAIVGDAGGLTLDPATGTLQGTPRAIGALSFRITLTDSQRASATEAYTLTINGPSLTIPTPAALPSATVGNDYTVAFTVTGGTAPFTWALASGSVPGLAFDASGATLSGNPTAAGSFTLSIQVRDSAGQSSTKAFTLTVAAPPLRFTTSGALPRGLLTDEYTHTIEASGGVPPYSFVATGLPAGLTMDSSTGTIRGTPGAAGQFDFTVRVTDSVRNTVAELYRLNIDLPTSPRVILSELPSVARPGEQLTLRVSTSDPFPVAINGQAVLTFQPDSGGGDSSIQFASGGRVADFTIPVGSTSPVLTTPLALQTGTVAGTITVTVRLRAGGIEISGTPAPAVVMRVERAAPVIQNVAVTRSGTTISIQITGYSTPREVTQAAFTFAAPAGQTLQNPTVTVPVEDVFNRWYGDPSSVAFGSIFLFTQSFNIQGAATGVTVQSVSLTNRAGTSTSTSIRQ